MKVDPQQLIDDGFIILRDVIPQQQIERMRHIVEVLVDRQKAESASRRSADQASGGEWYTSIQPRVNLAEVVDADTAEAVEFCLEENTLGASHQIMQAPESTVLGMQVMCSSIQDYGRTDWHRDSSAEEQTPLSGLQQDLQDNFPGYLQWNIPLYDDDVLWVVPGSHRRADSEAERRQLLLDPCVALPEGHQVKLKAGDGVVYTNLIMHWGSYYSSRMRRTIHLGYRSFGGDIFPYAHHFPWDEDLGFARHLSPQARSSFEHWVQLHARERDLIEATYRAIIEKDAEAFKAALARLHPGANWRMTCVVLLCRLVDKIHLLHTPEVAGLSEDERAEAIAGPTHHTFYLDFGDRFSTAEALALQQRFTPLSERLRQDGEKVHQHYAGVLKALKPDADPPNFRSRPLRTFHTEMPSDFGVDEFVRSWDE